MSIKFDKRQLDRMTNKLQKLADFGEVNYREIRKGHRKVLKIYVRKAKGMITDSGEDHYRLGNKITSGTLRRSVGVWKPAGQSRDIAMMAGPRAATRSFKRVAPYSRQDGFYAAWVNEGIAGDATHSTANKGVFDRARKQTASAMRQEQLNFYRQEFGRFVRKL